MKTKEKPIPNLRDMTKLPEPYKPEHDEDDETHPNETPNQRWRRLANTRGRNLFAAMDRMATLSASHHDFTPEEMETLIATCERKFAEMVKKLRNGGEDIFS